MKIQTSAYAVASRFIGIQEVPGKAANPAILAMLRLDQTWPESDEVPWCSAFVNYIAWLLGLPRSRSLQARSWLGVGEVVNTMILPSGQLAHGAEIGNDIVILSRGVVAPEDDGRTGPGHVGFFAGIEGDCIAVLGGNQSDSVSVEVFPGSRVLGIRRLA